MEVIMKKKTTMFISPILILCCMIPLKSAPLPIVSYFGFQPDGTPYHYWSFGDEMFFSFKYDGILQSRGSHCPVLPDNVSQDGWLRSTMPINGMYHLTNARYKLDSLDESEYPAANNGFPVYERLLWL